MTSARNPMKDRVAIAGAATTGFHPANTRRTQASYVAEAAKTVLDQCGLSPGDVDGLCGSLPAAPAVQSMLGIPEVTWFANPIIPFGNHLAAAASAVHSGLCDVVLAYHGAYRMAWNTSSALKDPFRRGCRLRQRDAGSRRSNRSPAPVGYTAWASRYIHEFGPPGEHLGYVAVNDRTNARANPAAAMRDPLTMDDYLAARMIRSPLCLLDMDVRRRRRRRLCDHDRGAGPRPRLPRSWFTPSSLGMTDKNEEDQTRACAATASTSLSNSAGQERLLDRRRRRVLPLRRLLDHRPQLDRERRVVRAGRSRVLHRGPLGRQRRRHRPDPDQRPGTGQPPRRRPL